MDTGQPRSVPEKSAEGRRAGGKEAHWCGVGTDEGHRDSRTTPLREQEQQAHLLPILMAPQGIRSLSVSLCIRNSKPWLHISIAWKIFFKGWRPDPLPESLIKIVWGGILTSVTLNVQVFLFWAGNYYSFFLTCGLRLLPSSAPGQLTVGSSLVLALEKTNKRHRHLVSARIQCSS